MTVRIGVIGTGNMGADHIRNLQRFVAGAEVTVVADYNRATAEAVAAESGARVAADGDALIADALPPEWPMIQLDPVLRALLRAGGAELSMANGPPARVVINEYLDVAHGFFTGEEPRMVNGMLDRLARELRPGDFPAEPASTH